MVKVPAPLLVSETVPVGAIVGAGDVSVTVTVQLAGVLIAILAGQLIVIVLDLRVEVTFPLTPLLV